MQESPLRENLHIDLTGMKVVNRLRCAEYAHVVWRPSEVILFGSIRGRIPIIAKYEPTTGQQSEMPIITDGLEYVCRNSSRVIFGRRDLIYVVDYNCLGPDLKRGMRVTINWNRSDKCLHGGEEHLLHRQ